MEIETSSTGKTYVFRDPAFSILEVFYPRLAHNLSVILINLNKIEQAVKLVRETLTISVNIIGELHPRTVTIVFNLALTLQRQGQPARAEELALKVLQRGQEILTSTNHPDILSSMKYLAELLEEQGKVGGAEAVRQKVKELTPTYVWSGGGGDGWGGGSGRSCELIW